MSRRKKQGMLGAVIAVAALVLVFQLALGMDPTTVFADDSGLAETQTVADDATNREDVGSADASAQSLSPAQSFEVTADNNVVVKVDAPEGALPEGVELHADVVSETEDVASELDNAGVSYDGFVALDVYFTDSTGAEVEPAQAVDVRFELPSGLVPEDAESVSVQHLAVRRQADVIGPQGVEILDALQNIGKVPQGVFGGLGGGVGGAGERTEGGYIYKAALVPPADVQGTGRAS